MTVVNTGIKKPRHSVLGLGHRGSSQTVGELFSFAAGKITDSMPLALLDDRGTTLRARKKAGAENSAPEKRTGPWAAGRDLDRRCPRLIGPFRRGSRYLPFQGPRVFSHGNLSPSVLSFDRLQFIRDLTPLIDEIEVDHAESRIWASTCTMLTFHRLLSTVVGPP
jgi:hypothetical protein